jgi:FKBP-type peptidyl-prolyl cis-trans isomerase
MKTIDLLWRTGLFTLFLTAFAVSAARADFSRPTGIWDTQARAAVSVKFADRKLKARPKSLFYSLIQFRENGGYTTIPWVQSPGRWQTLKGNKKAYRVELDLNELNAGHSTLPFLSALGTQFEALAKRRFGEVPTINRIEFTSFRDTGRLQRKGQLLVGNNKIRATVHFVDPATQQDTTAQVTMTLAYAGTRASAPSTCCTSDDPAQNQADSTRFLADNARLPGIRKTASGLQYRILNEEKGQKPAATDTVTINYRGILPSGRMFDADSGVSFPLNGVIAGFSEGLQLMPEGSYFRFYIPPERAYGEQGGGLLIKPNTALIFDVVLVKVGSSE